MSLTLVACTKDHGVPLTPKRPQFATGPLRTSELNRRYFDDGTGRLVYLTGAHTWLDLQDGGSSDPPAQFDYNSFLNQLLAHNHNFLRLWVWEQARWLTDTSQHTRLNIKDGFVAPLPYIRSGPGLALDGRLKFDLSRFDERYFSRLRGRVEAAAQRGIYVSVMLFNGWSIETKDLGESNPWRGHPFHSGNNICGIDGDPHSSGHGRKVHSLEIPAITALQESYVRKVVDTVNDLNNVIFEISNESRPESNPWQYHLIKYLKRYEDRKQKQHPVGMTVPWPGGSNADLLASPADWISPNGDMEDPPAADGGKIILDDTDHLCGVCASPSWVWRSFLRGRNPVLMDPCNFAASFGTSLKYKLDRRQWSLTWRNLGYTLTYANRVNLAGMVPRNDLASSRYCLADVSDEHAEYLVFVPAGGNVTLDAAPGRALAVEWFNPERGTVMSGRRVPGGRKREFRAPFGGDAVLYLKES